MFGNIVTNSKLLSDEDKKYYSKCYCGLCKALQDNYKNISRLTLNYDMTFLIILLNEIYKERNQELECRCFVHPFKKHNYIKGKFTSYVADMNILLSYYKMIDDWKDDKNIIAISYAKLIKNSFKKVCKKYPKKAEIVNNSLKKLSKIEKKNILNPDMPAKCSGEMFGYILDACIDLEKDIKHKKYNPLVTSSKKEFDDMLNLLLADCIEKYKQLNISNTLIENILYSGIWTKYEIYKKKGEK